MFEHPFKQYALFKDFERKVVEQEIDDIPAAIIKNKHARAYFGILKLADSAGSSDRFAELGTEIDRIVTNAVAENSLNPQNIEASVRKNVLPLLFKEIGLDAAKAATDKIIETVRIGLSRGGL